MAFLRIWDIFSRIKKAYEENKRLVLILPQPHPQYKKVAYLINKHRINCRHLYTFNMDEWADEDGNIAPESYPKGFLYAMMNNFYYNLDEDLRPPKTQIVGRAAVSCVGGRINTIQPTLSLIKLNLGIVNLYALLLFTGVRLAIISLHCTGNR